jgi:hypothetical protein
MSCHRYICFQLYSSVQLQRVLINDPSRSQAFSAKLIAFIGQSSSSSEASPAHLLSHAVGSVILPPDNMSLLNSDGSVIMPNDDTSLIVTNTEISAKVNNIAISSSLEPIKNVSDAINDIAIENNVIDIELTGISDIDEREAMEVSDINARDIVISGRSNDVNQPNSELDSQIIVYEKESFVQSQIKIEEEKTLISNTQSSLNSTGIEREIEIGSSFEAIALALRHKSAIEVKSELLHDDRFSYSMDELATYFPNMLGEGHNFDISLFTGRDISLELNRLARQLKEAVRQGNSNKSEALKGRIQDLESVSFESKVNMEKSCILLSNSSITTASLPIAAQATEVIDSP